MSVLVVLCLGLAGATPSSIRSMILVHDDPNTAVQRFLNSSCSRGNSGHPIPCHGNIFCWIQWGRDQEKKELSPDKVDFSSAETSLVFSATVSSSGLGGQQAAATDIP